MIHVVIGNWTIDNNGISWTGIPAIKGGFIPLDDLLVRRGNAFNALLHLAEKADVTENDIYALNTAFYYAVGYFHLELPEQISFIETVIKQQEIINLKNEEE